MLVALLNDGVKRDDVDVRFVYRASPVYEEGVKARVSPAVPTRAIRIPTAESTWARLLGRPRRIVRGLAYAMLVPQLFQLWTMGRLYFVFMRARPDLVHVNNGGFPATPSCNAAAAAARFARVPVIVYAVNNIAVGYRSPRRWPDLPLDRLTVRAVDRFVTGSTAAADALRRVLRLDAGHVSALPNGIARLTPHEPPSATRARLNVDRKAVLVIVVARLDLPKGHRCLLNAFHAFRQHSASDAVLVIVGEGPEQSNIEAQAQRLGLASEIRLVSAPHDELWALYAVADIVVLPSLSTEDFPYVVLEAMAMAKPVIGTAVAGIPEQIEHDVTGLVVPPGDEAALAHALEALATDPQRRADLGAAGRARYEALFTAEAAVRRYWELYDALLSARSALPHERAPVRHHQRDPST